jgi:hypothetical protein
MRFLTLPAILTLLSISETKTRVNLPKKLILNLNIYVDPEWHQILGKDSLLTAQQVMKEAAQLFLLPSLNTKIELIHSNRFFNSSHHFRTLARNMKKIVSELRAPFSVPGADSPKTMHRVAHVYLTHGGIVESRSVDGSICDQEKYSITAVQWGLDISSTAATAAHGIGHLLGIGHDFDRKDNRGKDCDEDNRRVFKHSEDKREEWSDCSNQEFELYYQRVVRDQKNFCLEEVSIKK